MSTWTDIRDSIEAPFKAVISTIQAPIHFVANVADGKNIQQSLTTAWRESGGALLGSGDYILRTKTGQQVLNSDLANTVTLGFSGNMAGFSTGINKYENFKPGDVTKDEKLRTVRTLATVGAAVVAAPAIAGASISTQLTGYAVASQVSKGNISGALAASGVALPDEVKQLQDTLAPLAPYIPHGGGVSVSDPYANPQRGGIAVTNNTTSNPYLIPAGIALALLILYKVKK